jgi:hypothetical protein
MSRCFQRHAQQQGNALTFLITSVAIMSLSLSVASSMIGPMFKQQSNKNSVIKIMEQVGDSYLDEVESFVLSNKAPFMSKTTWNLTQSNRLNSSDTASFIAITPNAFTSIVGDITNSANSLNPTRFQQVIHLGSGTAKTQTTGQTTGQTTPEPLVTITPEFGFFQREGGQTTTTVAGQTPFAILNQGSTSTMLIKTRVRSSNGQSIIRSRTIAFNPMASNYTQVDMAPETTPLEFKQGTTTVTLPAGSRVTKITGNIIQFGTREITSTASCALPNSAGGPLPKLECQMVSKTGDFRNYQHVQNVDFAPNRPVSFRASTYFSADTTKPETGSMSFMLNASDGTTSNTEKNNIWGLIPSLTSNQFKRFTVHSIPLGNNTVRLMVLWADDQNYLRMGLIDWTFGSGFSQAGIKPDRQLFTTPTPPASAQLATGLDVLGDKIADSGSESYNFYPQSGLVAGVLKTKQIAIRAFNFNTLNDLSPFIANRARTLTIPADDFDGRSISAPVLGDSEGTVSFTSRRTLSVFKVLVYSPTNNLTPDKSLDFDFTAALPPGATQTYGVRTYYNEAARQFMYFPYSGSGTRMINLDSLLPTAKNIFTSISSSMTPFRPEMWSSLKITPQITIDPKTGQFFVRNENRVVQFNPDTHNGNIFPLATSSTNNYTSTIDALSGAYYFINNNGSLSVIPPTNQPTMEQPQNVAIAANAVAIFSPNNTDKINVISQTQNAFSLMSFRPNRFKNLIVSTNGGNRFLERRMGNLRNFTMTDPMVFASDSYSQFNRNKDPNIFDRFANAEYEQ